MNVYPIVQGKKKRIQIECDITVRQDEFEDVYPNKPVNVENNSCFYLCGKMKNASQGGNIAISFKFGDEIVDITEVEIQAVNQQQEELQSTTDTTEKNSNNNQQKKEKSERDQLIPFMWTQKKLQSLSTYPELFEKELKEFGI